MYTTSNEYKNANLQPYRQFESRITIGNRIITNEEVVSINLQQSIQQEATFTIGNTISSYLNLTFLHNDIETSDREIINLEIGLLANSDYEYIPLGIYNIDLCNSNDTTTIIIAYDNMVKFDISYEENNSKPTVHSVINRLIELTGIEFAGALADYNNYNLVFLSGYSCREVLGFVAGALGCNAIIDRQGKFKFINISKTSSLTITNENYSNYFRQSKLYKISKLVNTLDESTIEIGSINDDTVCLNMTNPFVNEDILKDIYNKMNEFNFSPYELNWNGDLSLDLGDSIEIVDKKGTSLIQPILNQSFVYTGGLSSIVQAQGDTKLANTYTTKTKEEADLDRVKDDINNAVNKVDVMYYLSTSKEELKGGDWTTNAPTWTEGKYIWSKTVTEYKNGNIIDSDPVCITGAKGDQGLQGIQGEKGEQGIPGTPGMTYYTWIKYADDSYGNGISDSPTNKKYIGFAYNKTTPTESSNKSDYTWSLIQGEKGDTGVKGDTGANGITYYTWIKYSDNSNGNPCYDTPTSSTQYIGIAVNQITATESTDYTKYTWSKFKGDQGVKGEQGIPGTPGTNGKTTYFHIKYSSVSNPTSSSQMTETPSTYIGTYVDYTEADSTDPSKYTWSRFQGIQGEKGEQGIPGTNGSNGQTTYLHIKYSNDGGKTFTSNNGEDVGMYIGTYTDFNINDSSSVSSYIWNKVKGQGIDSVTEEYAINSDKANAPTTGWSTKCPPWETGKYLWTRSKIIYNNPTETVYTNPYCDSSWEAVNDVEIGGTNLILESSDAKTVTGNNTANQSNYFYTLSGVLEDYKDKTVTISYDYEISGTTKGGNIFVRLSANPWSHLDDTINLATAPKKGHRSKTITLPSTMTSLAIGTRADNLQGSITFSNMKLEKGNKATDWSPAPEDIYSEIEKVDDRISLIVSDGSTSSDLTITPSAISAIAKDIKLKATNITLEGLVTANSNFKILVDGSIEVKNGKFTGSITGSTITGSNIKGGTLTIGNTSEGNFFKINSDGSFQAGSVDQWNYKATITYGNSGFYVRAWDDANSKARTTTIDGDGVTVGTTVYSDKYISANGGTLTVGDSMSVEGNVTAASNLKANGNVNAEGNIYLLNNSASSLRGKDTSGNNVTLVHVGGDNISKFGYGSHNLNMAGSWFMGGKYAALMANNNQSTGTSKAGGTVYLCCNGATPSDGGLRVLEFTKDSNDNYLFRHRSNGVTKGVYLGSGSYRWYKLYSNAAADVSSDRTLKENIEYINGTITNYSAKTFKDINVTDMYNFVKDDLALAKYNYIDHKESTEIGFIAQDLLYNEDGSDNKVGQYIVDAKTAREENRTLSYNSGNYTNILAGALKQAIFKIEKLEEIIYERNTNRY